MANQDKDALGKLTSSKATAPDLVLLRKGSADDRTLSKLASQYGAMTTGKVVQGSRGDERTVVLEGGAGGADSKAARKGQMVMRKEDGGWKVFSISISTK